MEERSSNRGIWIIVAAVAVALMCCCALIAAALAGGLLWVTPVQQSIMGEEDGKRSWQRYEVGEAPELKIDNFSGSITVAASEDGAIEVVVMKQARRKADLERIDVDITRTQDGLDIRTRKPAGVSQAWVQLEIRAPADTRLDASTGSGSVSVQGMREVEVDSGSGGLVISDTRGEVDANTGSGNIEVSGARGRVTASTGSGGLRLLRVEGVIDAHTGSGSIEVRGSSGPVQLDSGSGGLQYEGSPQGECRFRTGSGSISLTLPADMEMELDLHSGSGRIDVDYEVSGPVSIQKTEVKGTVGSGEDASIWAHTGSGGIRLTQR